MTFDFAAAKKRTRREVMKTLGVDALYTDSTHVEPVPIRARWHMKIDRFGDNGNAGYAEVIEGIERVILDRDQARLIGVRRAGVITFPTLEGGTVTLEAREPAVGPVEEIWAVVSS